MFVSICCIVCLRAYRPDDDILEVETCRRNTSDYLFIYCAVCFITYSLVNITMEYELVQWLLILTSTTHRTYKYSLWAK